MNFAKLSAILVLCVLCISYLEHVNVLAESSDDLLKDSERTLSSLDDEAESRTLSGYHRGGYEKKRYEKRCYGSKYRRYGYRKYHDRKLEGIRGPCDCSPGIVKKGHFIYSFDETDPDKCCKECSKGGYDYSSYDVLENVCSCYTDACIKDSNDDKNYACIHG